MYPTLKSVKALADYKLFLSYSNGENRVFDVSSYLDHGVFQKLRNPNLFNQVYIAFDSIEWPQGIDLDPEELYSESAPV